MPCYKELKLLPASVDRSLSGLKESIFKSDMMAYTCNPNTQETEWEDCELKVSVVYTVSEGLWAR